MPHGWLGVSHLKGRGWGRAGSRQQSTFWAKRTAGAQALGCKEQVSLRKQKKSKVTLAQSMWLTDTKMRPERQAGPKSDYSSPFRSKQRCGMSNGNLLRMEVTWLYLHVRKTHSVMGWQRVDLWEQTAVIWAWADNGLKRTCPKTFFKQ